MKLVVAPVVALLALGVGACAGETALTTRARSSVDSVPPPSYEHYIRARLAAETGDHAEAVAELRMALATSPDDAELLVASGQELLLDGKIQEARTAAEAAVARWPNHGPALRLLGLTRERLGDLPGAATAFAHAIKAAPAEESSYLLLADVDVKLDDDAGAIAAYQQLVDHVPGSAAGHLQLGGALLDAGHPDAAAPQLERAVSLDPDDVDARLELAEAHRRAGQSAAAQDALREALDRSNGDMRVAEALFRLLLERGDRAGAAALLAGLDGDSRDPVARLRLAYDFLQLRGGADALRIADAVLAHDPADHTARLIAARALVQLGRRGEAISRCLEIPDSSDDYTAARALLAELYGRGGMPQRGLALVDEALGVHPEDPMLLAARATLLEKLGDVAGARTLLTTALERTPADETLAFARAALEDRAGQPDRAIAIMKDHLERDPKSVAALNFIGYSYVDRGVELDAAEGYLRRAAALRPDDGFVVDSLGWLDFQRGHLDAAAALLERADRLAPFEPEILLHLGELYLRRGDATRARAVMHEALSLDPDDKTRGRLEERVRTLEARKSP